jgi:hypothetical protein
VLVGAWGLICGYVGPYFGFRPMGYNAWSGSLQEGLLHAAPGGAAILGGLMLMAIGPARRVHGFGFVVPAILVLGAGAWFVIGPVAWPVIESGSAFVSASPLRNLLNVAAASYAPGLALAMLGGMALKAAIVPRIAVADPMTPVEADRGVDEPVRRADEPVRRNRRFGRRSEVRDAEVRHAEARDTEDRTADPRSADQPVDDEVTAARTGV